MCQVAVLHSVNYMQSAHPPRGSFLVTLPLLSVLSLSSICPIGVICDWIESRGRAHHPECKLSLY